jgi:2-keto-4-pentenoate hydratase/2-oxohepta-3-ene-1,7-dioic acid hydratase in catechol pathway
MRYLRVGPTGRERPVLLTDDDRAFELDNLTDDIDAAFLSTGLVDVHEALAAGSLSEIDIDGARIGPPLARPESIICVGMNYAAHAAESGSPPPSDVIVFFKKNNTIVGPDDDVLRAPGSTQLDWEAEIGVVIGRTCRRLTGLDSALASVAGYLLANDVSERHDQLEVSGGQWSKGKCGETYSPVGPWLATPDYVGDPQSLRLRSWVNDQPRQDSSSADMIFSVAEIIVDLSRYMVLEPGDLILTGTPQGVALSGRFPYLNDGDIVRLEADRLGSMRQTVRAAQP